MYKLITKKSIFFKSRYIQIDQIYYERKKQKWAKE